MKTNLLTAFREKDVERSEANLIEKLQSKEINPDTLSTGEKVEIANILKLRGWKIIEIANLLGRKTRQISNYYAMAFKRRAKLVKMLSIERVAGDFIAYGDSLRTDAIKNGNLGLAWDITCDMVRILQEMGLIYRAPVNFKGEVKGEFDIRTVPDDDIIAATKSIFDRSLTPN